MVQIKTGHESPVIVVLGPNCRPPNSSHFRNLKHLKIDMVVSQKKKRKRKEREKERRKERTKREGGGREEEQWEGRDKNPLRKCQLTRIPSLERKEKCINFVQVNGIVNTVEYVGLIILYNSIYIMSLALFKNMQIQ